MQRSSATSVAVQKTSEEIQIARDHKDYGARDFLPCKVTRLHCDTKRRVIGQVISRRISARCYEGFEGSPPFKIAGTCSLRQTDHFDYVLHER